MTTRPRILTGTAVAGVRGQFMYGGGSGTSARGGSVPVRERACERISIDERAC